MNLPNLIKYRKITVIALAAFMVLVLVLPLYESWVPMEFEPYWQTVYLINDEEMLIFTIPFYLLFPLSRILKNIYVRGVINLILLCITGFHFLIGLVSRMPIQDYIPRLGTLALMAFLPTLLVIIYLDWQIRITRKKNQT